MEKREGRRIRRRRKDELGLLSKIKKIIVLKIMKSYHQRETTKIVIKLNKMTF